MMVISLVPAVCTFDVLLRDDDSSPFLQLAALYKGMRASCRQQPADLSGLSRANCEFIFSIDYVELDQIPGIHTSHRQQAILPITGRCTSQEKEHYCKEMARGVFRAPFGLDEDGRRVPVTVLLIKENFNWDDPEVNAIAPRFPLLGQFLSPTYCADSLPSSALGRRTARDKAFATFSKMHFKVHGAMPYDVSLQGATRCDFEKQFTWDDAMR